MPGVGGVQAPAVLQGGARPWGGDEGEGEGGRGGGCGRMSSQADYSLVQLGGFPNSVDMAELTL